MANDDTSKHLIYTTLTNNSTTLYTYENKRLAQQLVSLNCAEIISQELGVLDSSSSLIGSIPLNYKINSDTGSPILMLYFMKKILSNTDLITVVTIASSELNKSFVLAILKKVLDKYLEFQRDAEDNSKLGEFKLTMNQIIKFEENKLHSNALNLANQEVDEVRDVMVDNIERVLERGERINLLVSKTDRINNSASAFRRRSIAIKRRMWWNNFKLISILILSGLFLLYLLIGTECGLPFYDRCLS